MQATQINMGAIAHGSIPRVQTCYYARSEAMFVARVGTSGAWRCLGVRNEGKGEDKDDHDEHHHAHEGATVRAYDHQEGAAVRAFVC